MNQITLNLLLNWQSFIMLIAIVSLLVLSYLFALWNINRRKQKLVTLIKRESLYRTLFDNTGTSTILVDSNFKIILSNTEFECLTEYHRNELENKKNLISLLNKADRSTPAKCLSKGDYSSEIRLVNKNNKTKHCLCKLTPIKGANQYIISFTDISKSKLNEQLLISSKEQFRAILNSIPSLIFSIDYNGKIIDLQEFRIKHISYFKKKAEVGAYLSELFEVNTGNIINNYIENVRDKKLEANFEFSIIPEKKTLHFEAQIVPVVNDQLLFILHDITDRVEKEKTIKILGHAVKGVSECINITDENNIIQFVNQAFCDTYGYTEEEIIGKNINMIVADNNDPEILSEIKAARLKGSWHGELLNLKKDGTEFPVYLSTSLVKDDNLKTIAIFAVALDISDRIKQTNNINSLNQKLSEKNKELEQIIYIASHDLRSPLINIEGFSYELNKISNTIKENLSDKQVQILKENEEIYDFFYNEMPTCLDYIIVSTKKMDALIAGLLKISRLGKDPVRIEEIDMKELINEVIQSFSYQISQRNAKIITKDFPDCKGDIMLLNQVFSNLVSNSLKYALPSVSPIIEIGGTKKTEHVTYYIKDNGPGIPETKLDEIFKIFYRLSNDNSGDGLGLSIVKKLISKHNGRVFVENIKEGGCVFNIELPLY